MWRLPSGAGLEISFSGGGESSTAARGSRSPSAAGMVTECEKSPFWCYRTCNGGGRVGKQIIPACPGP